MLKLRKVELSGFKSFCEKTPITFSGSGITCIVGPNGCGKSNVVDAISWVLGEQSHKMLRAERMSDCIFNGTSKRPPMGMSEVTLTLIDPELSEAVAKVMEGVDDSAQNISSNGMLSSDGDHGSLQVVPSADDSSFMIHAQDSLGQTEPINGAEASSENRAGEAGDDPDTGLALSTGKKRRGQKPTMTVRPGEVVVGRRLYRSGQSEYMINGRVARLRDVQEIFMGVGLGPDSYAIIEQGRIGQILNSKPMDRRAIIEEAAGITMYKTKRRLAEAKLEASRLNLSRVNDILVEVEKQVASLKRQASKARRYAALREQMRGMLRSVLASKAEHLDIEAARLAQLLGEMDAAEERDARSLHDLESEQERLSTRTYDLDVELRQTQNILGQTALDLDRAENRITFNREQAAQIESRAIRLSAEVELASRHAAELVSRVAAQREAVSALREQTRSLEEGLREAMEQASASVIEQSQLESRIADLRKLAGQLVEQSARDHAESLKAEEAAERHAAAESQRSAAMRDLEMEWSALADRVNSAEALFDRSTESARQFGASVRLAQARIAEFRREVQETTQQLEATRENLSGERARLSSIEQILKERAYTADAVQKLFSFDSSNGTARISAELGGSGDDQLSSNGFRAIGLLADYAEVQEQYETAIEQFLREELEYVVVESFDQARAGVALLRDEVGGRATFFVDLGNALDAGKMDNSSSMPGDFIERLDRLVDFRAPLGPATKYFLKRLRTAYLVETPAIAERMAHDNPHSYFLTTDGTCYHGRTVSGGRKSDAGPLALKRELRQHEAEIDRLEAIAQVGQAELTRLEEGVTSSEAELASATSQHMEAEKALVAATHQRDQARTDLHRTEHQLGSEREEITRLRTEAENARARAENARAEHAEALNRRSAAEAESAEAAEKAASLRLSFQALQERVVAKREELATMAERLASAEAIESRLSSEIAQASERVASVSQQHEALVHDKSDLESACGQLAEQAETLRQEKSRLELQKELLEIEWETSRKRSGEMDESLRGRRSALDELRAERGQRQIERARNDADRDYLRQTCVAELNAQPEELVAQETQLLIGEELVAAETTYNEMKARAEAMGPVNMMALEEFQEAEQREVYLRRERDDLVDSIKNTQLTINELDQVSRQKFEDAFQFINRHFAIAFQTLFGGGTGEMRLGEPDSSGEAGIDIVAQPPGKRLQNILLLSGGEKALTALALLIAVFHYRPSPFCILDEVDAPLDEANVGRFTKMLGDMCGQTQFIVVTHNRRTMEMGSVLYGVTMQEPGVSKLVSVKWEDSAAEAPKETAAAASNAA